MNPFHRIISNKENKLTRRIYTSLDIPLSVFRSNKFDCGEYFFMGREKYSVNKEVLACFFIDKSEDIHKQLFQLAMMLHTLKDSKVTLFMPYMPYGRNNDESLFSFFHDLFSSWKLEKFITFESHHQKYIFPSKVYEDIPMDQWVSKHMKDVLIDSYQAAKWVIVAPDEGAQSRAKSVANELDLPYLGLKKRRQHDGLSFEKTHYLEINEPLSFCIIDDMIDSGQTLHGAASFLQSNFINVKHIFAYVTHLLKPISTRGLTAIYVADLPCDFEDKEGEGIFYEDTSDYLCEFLLKN